MATKKKKEDPKNLAKTKAKKVKSAASKKPAKKVAAKTTPKKTLKKKTPKKVLKKKVASKKSAVKKSTVKKPTAKKPAPKKIAAKKILKKIKKKSPKKSTTSKQSANPAQEIPSVSIVIPIYNEEGIVSASVADLTEKLKNEPKFNRSYEIILSENGSSDNTIPIVEKIMMSNPNVRLIRVGEPNYGLAMRKGILMARADLVICDEIDLCDVDFYVRALHEIETNGFDLVVGSKALDSSHDKRPLYRKAATFTLNSLLRVFLGFKGTDTHGLKALRKSRLLEVVDRCVVEKDLFASEFVIRTTRMGFRSKEIPVTIAEKRPPSINLINRVPGVLKNLGELFWVIRVKHR